MIQRPRQYQVAQHALQEQLRSINFQDYTQTDHNEISFREDNNNTTNLLPHFIETEEGEGYEFDQQ